MSRFLFVAGAIALLPVCASAQVNTLELDNPREKSRVRFGPFYITPQIALKEFGVDTNVLNENQDAKRDFTTTVEPIMRVWVPFARRALIKGTIGSDLVWYKETASERSIDPSFHVRGETYFRRFTLFGEHSYLYTRHRPNFELDLRSRRRERSWRGGVDFRLTPKVWIEAQGSGSSSEFVGDAFFLGTNLRETLNRDVKGVSMIGRYRLTPLTTAVVRAERFEERFELSPARNADSVKVMAGFHFAPRALLNGSATIGFRHLNPLDENVLPEFKGLVIETGVSYTLLGATTFSLGMTRDVNYSYELTQPYYIATGNTAAVRRALGPRFDVIVSAERHRYAYQDLLSSTSPVVPAAEPRVDTTWTFGGSLGYLLGRDARVGFGATYWRRTSTTRTFREYDGFRLGTTATYGF